MSTQRPSVTRMVHYVSYGTPGGEYTSECRAAIVTAVPEPDADGNVLASLCVINPTGMFFNQYVVQDEDSPEERAAGTWHWPERVE